MALWRFGVLFSFFLAFSVQLWSGCGAFAFPDDMNGEQNNVELVRVEVNGMQSIASVDEGFVCATLDWWPPQKCDYGRCSWGNASILNLDLQNPILHNAVKGNELSGPGVGGSIPASQYAVDVKKLRAIIDEIYKTSSVKPLIVAPDGFLNARWYEKLLHHSGPRTLDVCTRHIYNLGSGVDKNLVRKILNPFYLSKEVATFKLLDKILLKYGPWAHAWIGEAGGAYNSGQNLVSNAFVSSFWRSSTVLN